MVVSLNSRLEINKEEEEEYDVLTDGARDVCPAGDQIPEPHTPNPKLKP